MTQYKINSKKSENRDNRDYYSNIIKFPGRNCSKKSENREIADPFIVITSDNGRVCDKLGMSGDECCYILPPHVNVVSINHAIADADQSHAQTDQCRTRVARVILSEADGVSEIPAHLEGGETVLSSNNPEMRWIIPGHYLVLGRRSPEHVAMLSLKLTFANN